jgi:uncharacterized protein
MSEFLKLFKNNKPIVGMLHLGRRETKEDALELTKKEIDAYMENGMDGVIVEDYFGDLEEVEKTLEYLYDLRKDIIYGVNYLSSYKKAFELAKDYDAKFIQIDSLSGHLTVSDDFVYGEQLNKLRELTNKPIIGGVRFKYQPYLSQRTLEEDLIIGMQRSDGIVVTGEGTGLETPLDKAKKFKEIIKDFPLIIGAGLNMENCIESLTIGDATIVGSYVKDNHCDYGEVSAENVKKLINKINTIR